MNAGDVIEVAVAGVPELRQRVAVQLDGSISLPLLGTITVAGSSASEARIKIQSALATKVFRQRTPDGGERPLIIELDEVAATVVEYRPIYVSGDVASPGQQTYRPHMTVRQAVAASGGLLRYDVLQSGKNSALREAIELQADYASLWLSFAKERAHIWRIKSELGAEIAFDQNIFKRSPLRHPTLSDILRVETEHLKARKANYERERTFLQRAVTQADKHIAVLSDKQKKEQQGRQADLQELQRITRLFEKGTLIMPRVTEARRALLWSSTRELETSAQLMRVIRQRDQLSRQLEKLDDERTINLLQELQDARVTLSGIQAKLQSIGQKLQYPTDPQVAGQKHRTRKITVFRKGENGEVRFVAKGETELQPGDVVDVALWAEDHTEVASH